jgi:type IV secretory pathway ATPase VirB11/archaellum biosynthesis ATPase
MVLVAGARATTHIPTMKELEKKLKLPNMKIKNTFKQINIIAIQYAHSISVHKKVARK